MTFSTHHFSSSMIFSLDSLDHVLKGWIDFLQVISYSIILLYFLPSSFSTQPNFLQLFNDSVQHAHFSYKLTQLCYCNRRHSQSFKYLLLLWANELPSVPTTTQLYDRFVSLWRFIRVPFHLQILVKIGQNFLKNSQFLGRSSGYARESPCILCYRVNMWTGVGHVFRKN